MARDEAIDMDFEALQVLVVDDDPALLSVTCRMLKAMGYQVDTAGDGVQAMECIRRKQYSIVVSDMQMPIPGWFFPGLLDQTQSEACQGSYHDGTADDRSGCLYENAGGG